MRKTTQTTQKFDNFLTLNALCFHTLITKSVISDSQNTYTTRTTNLLDDT